MQEFAYEPDWEDIDELKYFITYDYKFKIVETDWNRWMQRDNIYFESEEQIQACIDAVGKDRIKKYYFRIKED